GPRGTDDAGMRPPLPHGGCHRGERRGWGVGGYVRRSEDDPAAAGDRGDRRPQGGAGLQERLGGWPLRADAVVRGEPEPRRMGGPPREAGVLPGTPRRAAGPRDAVPHGPEGM
ncbi:MAG: hypothetical protein AVDCRST_MAG80-877, partial [uncultured Rubrobacteraceae bacterium]